MVIKILTTRLHTKAEGCGFIRYMLTLISKGLSPECEVDKIVPTQ